MPSPAQVQNRGYRYADYCAWPDDQRWELIDGTAYDMSPAPSRRHQEVLGELFVQIKTRLGSSPCRVYVAPFDIRLPAQDEADDEVMSVVQPDIAVICDQRKLDDRGCRGAPDWIIEVLSPTTAAKDQIQKRDLYARHGVAEYWLVHPLDRLVIIYRLEAGDYGRPEIQETRGETPVDLFPGLAIDWDVIYPEPSPGA